MWARAAMAALASSLLFQFSLDVVSARPLAHEAPRDSARRPDGRSSHSFKVGGKTHFVFILNEIKIYDEAINPEPRLVSIDRCSLGFADSNDAVLLAEPFQWHSLIWIKNIAHRNLVYIDRRIWRIWVFVVANSVDDHPLNAELTHSHPRSAGISDRDNKSHFVDICRDGAGGITWSGIPGAASGYGTMLMPTSTISEISEAMAARA